MKRFIMATIAAGCAVVGSVVVPATEGGATSGAILTEESNVGQIFTNNFNPADSQSTGTQMSLNALSFQPLILWNSLKSHESKPWLASSEVLNATGQVVTFTISPKAIWSNGAPLTARDVANEFNALSNNASLNVFGVPPLAQPATAVGNKVTLTYATPQFANEEALGSVLIFPVAGDTGVPRSSQIVSGTTSLSWDQVVGNGPYLPSGYSGQLIKYSLSPHWLLTAKPQVTGVNIPYFASNQAATQALVSNQLDWAGNDIPQITATFTRRDPVHNHYYYPAGSTVTLWFNLSSSAPHGRTSCLADPAFRSVVSGAINRKQLAQLGETGFADPATSTSGLTPQQAPYLGPFKNNIAASGWSKSKVASAMAGAGYTIGSKGFYQVTTQKAQDATGLPAGTVCQFTIQDPVAYSDYAEDMLLISQQLQAVHIKVSSQGVATGQWNANITTHNFDAIIHWGAGGSNPYTQFQNWLGDPAYTGGSTNYGYYVNPQVQRDLVSLAAARPGTASFQALVTKIGTVMTNDVPVAPLFYGPDWDVYSTLHFTGWVTAQNQYAYPGPAGNAIGYVLTRLKKA